MGGQFWSGQRFMDHKSGLKILVARANEKLSIFYQTDLGVLFLSMQHKNMDSVLLRREIIVEAISPSSEFHPFSPPFFGNLPTKKINIRILILSSESFRHELRENVRSSPSREGKASFLSNYYLIYLFPIFFGGQNFLEF